MKYLIRKKNIIPCTENMKKNKVKKKIINITHNIDDSTKTEYHILYNFFNQYF